MNLKISATVILYNPEDNVFENIVSYVNNIDILIVVDNSTEYNNYLINKLHQEFKNMIYINNNENLGIGTALNIGCDKAIELGYDWILTMDQDSKFIDINKYLDCSKNIIDKEQNIGIITLNHSHHTQKTKDDECNYIQKDIVIASGNLVNLKHFNNIGRFDDNLFIDMVDYDFSHKVIINDLKIFFLHNIYIIHELGEVFKRKNLITRKIKEKIEHNSQRVYYITRNRLYLSKIYRKYFPKEYSLLKTINILFIHEVTKIILYEDNKLNKLYGKFLGLYHFLVGKYGKYDI